MRLFESPKYTGRQTYVVLLLSILYFIRINCISDNTNKENYNSKIATKSKNFFFFHFF